MGECKVAILLLAARRRKDKFVSFVLHLVRHEATQLVHQKDFAVETLQRGLALCCCSPFESFSHSLANCHLVYVEPAQLLLKILRRNLG